MCAHRRVPSGRRRPWFSYMDIQTGRWATQQRKLAEQQSFNCSHMSTVGAASGRSSRPIPGSRVDISLRTIARADCNRCSRRLPPNLTGRIFGRFFTKMQKANWLRAKFVLSGQAGSVVLPGVAAPKFGESFFAMQFDQHFAPSWRKFPDSHSPPPIRTIHTIRTGPLSLYLSTL